jgi:hypothetical protein
VKDLCNDNKYSKYFFFKNRLELIKFIKYVALPTFVYNKINLQKSIRKVEIQDYKDVLNFFMGNDISNSNELIKRYSFFYNSLEEFEYEKNDIGETAFIELIENINLYFSKDEFIKSNMEIYLGTEALFESILEHEDEYFREKIVNDLGAKNKEELNEFLANHKNNVTIINFIAEVLSEICDGNDIVVNL